MKGKRTSTDFSNHELLVSKERPFSEYTLKKPDTTNQCVRFICCYGVTLVTGDFGEWVFNREFHPSAEERSSVSDGYWLGKMYGESGASGVEFDGEQTIAEIDGILNIKWQEDNLGRWLSGEEIEYLEACKEAAQDHEFVYDSVAHRENVGYFGDHESVPKVKKIKFWLLVVFDAFDEICRRMREQELKNT